MVKYNITLDPKLPHLHHLLLQHLVADSIKIPVLHDYTLYPKNFVVPLLSFLCSTMGRRLGCNSWSQINLTEKT